MADLWTSDRNALGERTRIGLSSIAQTRAAVVAKHSTQEKPMRLFKLHPALSALLILAVIGMFGSVAYAIVDKVWLSVDIDQSADEIQDDIQSQLEAAGVKAKVTAEKSGNSIGISIDTDDRALGSNLGVVIPDLPDGVEAFQIRLDVRVELTDAQEKRLQAVMAGPAFTSAIEDDTLTPAQLEVQMKKAFADAGFQNVELKVEPSGATITVKAPPV